jgi:hypothetical protein
MQLRRKKSRRMLRRWRKPRRRQPRISQPRRRQIPRRKLGGRQPRSKLCLARDYDTIVKWCSQISARWQRPRQSCACDRQTGRSPLGPPGTFVLKGRLPTTHTPPKRMTSVRFDTPPPRISRTLWTTSFVLSHGVSLRPRLCRGGFSGPSPRSTSVVGGPRPGCIGDPIIKTKLVYDPSGAGFY